LLQRGAKLCPEIRCDTEARHCPVMFEALLCGVIFENADNV